MENQLAGGLWEEIKITFVAILQVLSEITSVCNHLTVL